MIIWKPLSNGTHKIDKTYSTGNDWPTVAHIEGSSLDVSNMGCNLADNIRLCEALSVPGPIPLTPLDHILSWIEDAMGVTGLASDPDLRDDVAQLRAYLSGESGDGRDAHE